MEPYILLFLTKNMTIKHDHHKETLHLPYQYLIPIEFAEALDTAISTDTVLSFIEEHDETIYDMDDVEEPIKPFIVAQVRHVETEESHSCYSY